MLSVTRLFTVLTVSKGRRPAVVARRVVVVVGEKSRCRYSTLTVQFCDSRPSMPPPNAQPATTFFTVADATESSL
jgi:hypothetical protein